MKTGTIMKRMAVWFVALLMASSGTVLAAPFDTGGGFVLLEQEHDSKTSTESSENKEDSGKTENSAPGRFHVTVDDFISVIETAKGTRMWRLSFWVNMVGTDGTEERIASEIIVPHNNANISGIYPFPEGHLLAGYALHFAVRNNGALASIFHIIRVGDNGLRLTVNVTGNGTVNTGGGFFQYGEQIELMAVPDTGYEFVAWHFLGSGRLLLNPDEPANVFVMPNVNTMLTAHFRRTVHIGEGDVPVIVVQTEFPHGFTRQASIDVVYTAIPSRGEAVAEVYVIRNGERFRPNLFLYVPERGTTSGTLGVGRFPLINGVDNLIEVVVVDTAGRRASYVVGNVPHPVFSLSAPQREEDIEYVTIDGVVSIFNTTQITIWGRRFTFDFYEAEAVLNTYGYKIVGFAGAELTVQVPRSTFERLHEIGNYLVQTYPNIFNMFFVDIGTRDLEEIRAMQNGFVPTNDPWWSRRGLLRLIRPRQWSLDSVNFPLAWDNFGNHQRSIPVGVIDVGGFRYSHEDLQVPRWNISNSYLMPHREVPEVFDKCHGTHVMATIGATHNNELGIAGAININRNSLFGQDPIRDRTVDTHSFNASLTSLVKNGASVINVSMNRGLRIEPERVSRRMQELLDYGYSFIVVQAAGNNAVESGATTIFTHTEGENPDPRIDFPYLRNRTITVGATDRNGRMASFSNWGDFVDVLAPGVEIYSAISINRTVFGTVTQSENDYENKLGTSMAAPHVTALAALIWDEFPELAAYQVRYAITISAREHGLRVVDTRNGRNRVYFQIDADAAMHFAETLCLRSTEGLLAALSVIRDASK